MSESVPSSAVLTRAMLGTMTGPVGQAQRGNRLRGFTLVEVLVAMAIIAVGVSALVISSGASARRADILRDREMARWVASNRLTELQSVPAWPDLGTTNSEVELAASTWYLRTITQEAADSGIRRVDVEVRRDEDAEAYIYKAFGFVGNPGYRQ